MCVHVCSRGCEVSLTAGMASFLAFWVHVSDQAECLQTIVVISEGDSRPICPSLPLLPYDASRITAIKPRG